MGPQDIFDFMALYFTPDPTPRDRISGRSLAGASGTLIDNPYGYCGYYFDAETAAAKVLAPPHLGTSAAGGPYGVHGAGGLYHVRYRVYDPWAGRWLTRDPAGFVDGSNLYEYAMGGPSGVFDPFGLSIDCVTNELGLTTVIGSHSSGAPVLTVQGGGPPPDAFDQLGVGGDDLRVGSGPRTDAGRQLGRNATAFANGVGDAASAPFRAIEDGLKYVIDGGLNSLDLDPIHRLVISYQGAVDAIANALTIVLAWESLGEEEQAYVAGGAAFKLGVAAVSMGGGSVVGGAGAVARGAAGARGAVPGQLSLGRAYEAQRLQQMGLTKNTITWRPTAADINSSAFNVIVGKAKYTPGGLPEGTIVDVSQGGLREIKSGTSVLNSRYQIRLQTFYSLKNNIPYVLETSRPINPTFQGWLERWGVTVQRPN